MSDASKPVPDQATPDPVPWYLRDRLSVPTEKLPGALADLLDDELRVVIDHLRGVAAHLAGDDPAARAAHADALHRRDLAMREARMRRLGVEMGPPSASPNPSDSDDRPLQQPADSDDQPAPPAPPGSGFAGIAHDIARLDRLNPLGLLPSHLALGGPYVVLDIETTGLDHLVHDITEIAWVRVEADGTISAREHHFVQISHERLIEADLVALDMTGFFQRHPTPLGQPTREHPALRRPDTPHPVTLGLLRDALIDAFTLEMGDGRASKPGRGAHLVGAVPAFEDRWLRRHVFSPSWATHPEVPPWHYHLIDVEAMAVGFLRGFDLLDPLTPSPTFGPEPDAAGHPDDIEPIDTHLVGLPWSSDAVSLQLDVDPGAFERHTAMGDVDWVLAQIAAIGELVERRRADRHDLTPITDETPLTEDDV